MQETYLIKLKDNTSQKDFMRVAAFLKSNNAQILMVGGNWFLAVVAQQLAEAIRRIPIVERVGGVTFKKRDVKVIRRQKPK